jgi:hypothetical protein
MNDHRDFIRLHEEKALGFKLPNSMSSVEIEEYIILLVSFKAIVILIA